MPVYQLGNKIHMHEGAGGVKRGQTELEKNLHHDKWRKREGIKRGLRDIPQVQYEGYETSWDQEIQAKKCKGSINCQDVPAVQSNPISPANSQSTRNTRRHNRS